MRSSRLIAVFVVAAAVAFGLVRLLDVRPSRSAAQHVDSAEQPVPNVVHITAREYAFEAPDTVPAGLTTLEFTNAGNEFHHAWLARLEDGKTLDDLGAAVAAGGPPPTWLVDVGGPNAPTPQGGESNMTVNLEPGTYVLVCHIPSPGDDIAHLAKGMIRPIVVTGPAAPAPLPEASVTVVLKDFDFEFSGALERGRQVIRVRNDAAQPHEMFIARLAPGKTAGDLLAWLGDEQGPPPAIPMGGATGLASGKEGQFEVTLEPGEYALICFVPDATDGKPHFVHGMVKQVRVS